MPDFDPEKPLEMALSIDRTISKMRSQAVDPAFDRSRSLQERAQYMPEAPAARMKEASEGDRRSTTDVAWLPYMSRKEKLESWIEPTTQDAGDKRTLYKQMSKLEQG